MNERDPIPKDGEVLHASNLHALATFMLAEAGRGLRGAWGFFRPSTLADDESANCIYVEDNKVIVKNLALITRDGFTLVETTKKLECELPSMASASLCLKWKLSEPLREGERGAFPVFDIVSIDQRVPRCRAAIVGKVSGLANMKVDLHAPALSLDAAKDVQDKWNSLAAKFRRLARLVGRSLRGGLFERRLVQTALQGLAELPPETAPVQATREMKTVAHLLAAFVEAHADSGVYKEVDGLVERVKECSGAVGVTRLCDALERARLDKMPTTERWLQTTTRDLRRVNTQGEDGNKVVHHYDLSDVTEATVFVALARTSALDPEAHGRFDDGEWHLFEGKATVDQTEASFGPAPEGAHRFSLKCADSVEIKKVTAGCTASGRAGKEAE